MPQPESLPPSPAAGNPVALLNALTYGSLETRRRLAAELARGHDGSVWALLCGTARSAEPWQIRARCLELLGMAVGLAEREVAEQILAAVAEPGAAGGVPASAEPAPPHGPSAGGPSAGAGRSPQ